MEKGKPSERLGRKTTGLKQGYFCHDSRVALNTISFLGVILVFEANTIDKEIDAEWVELIIEAKEMGIPIEEIRKFLYHTKCEKEK